MARVLLAWELGAGTEHLAHLVPLALRIRARGHEPVFALSDVTRAQATLGAHGFPYLQAPMWHCRLPRPTVVPCSYSEILHHYGYLDAEGLLGLVKAWREIYALVEPRAILFEHAPTALLASRGSETARIITGVGFSTPPRERPLPSFRTWEPVLKERLERSDTLVLGTVNAVLARLRLRPLAELSELFDADAEFLCTFPELDHYAVRGGGDYCGPVFDRADGAGALWPQGSGTRVYVDLRPGMPAFNANAEALSDSGLSVLWSAPGASDDVVRRYASASLRFTRERVCLADVAERAQAVVLSGSHGPVSAMLLAGVPMALYPLHVEQALVSRNAARMGAALVAAPQSRPPEVRGAISRIVGEPRYREAAQTFAAKYRDFDPKQVVARISRKVGTYCGPASRRS